MTVSGTAPKIASKEQLFSHSVEHGHTYRVIEVVGTSEKGIDDAIRSAIDRAHQTIRGLSWCEVSRITGHIKNGLVTHFQVTLKVGFTLDQSRVRLEVSGDDGHST
jgi:dodecin